MNIKNMSEKILIRTKSRTHLVLISEILYCKGAGAYSVLYLRDSDEIVASVNLVTLHSKILPHRNIFRVGQSFLVNLEYVKCIYHSPKEIEFFNNIRIPYTVTVKMLEEELRKL